MTAFSLFHRPLFDMKLRKIQSPLQIQALLASMFLFSAHFREGCSNGAHNVPLPEYFLGLATRFINEALEECLEETPPLCLLQALILTTFQMLVKGVRGRAWRSLGTCVRMAYELQLHLVDSKRNECPRPCEKNVDEWVMDEERRRAWWTIWEFDVFASTIRRLPTAIDWSRNETWLPVSDEFWFNNTFKLSCHLDQDPNTRWKKLEACENKSGKAWFVVVNSLMRNAQTSPAVQGFTASRTSPSRTPTSSKPNRPRAVVKESIDELTRLSDALCCYAMALPMDLAHHGGLLKFRACEFVPPNSRQNECDKYSIHVMKQLTRFMIYHQQVFEGTNEDVVMASNQDVSDRHKVKKSSTLVTNHGALSRYLDAADEITTLIRNSSPSHVQYVNPFLASTIWLAAATQVASRMFGPSTVNEQALEANLDLLRLTFSRFVSFWNISNTLQERLNMLQSHLETIQSHEKAKQAANQVLGSRQQQPIPLQHDGNRRSNPTEFQSQENFGNFSPLASQSQPELPSTTSPDTSFDEANYSLPAPNFDFDNFHMMAGEPFDSWELQELLTYGYD